MAFTMVMDAMNFPTDVITLENGLDIVCMAKDCISILKDRNGKAYSWMVYFNQDNKGN